MLFGTLEPPLSAFRVLSVISQCPLGPGAICCSDVTYEGRPVLHRFSLVEMAVPYADPRVRIVLL